MSSKKSLRDIFFVNTPSESGELSALIGVNSSRVKVYLQELIAEGFFAAEGAYRNRTYRLKKKDK